MVAVVIAVNGCDRFCILVIKLQSRFWPAKFLRDLGRRGWWGAVVAVAHGGFTGTSAGTGTSTSTRTNTSAGTNTNTRY